MKYNFWNLILNGSNLKKMSKYTEDDLKSNSKLKNMSTDFTPIRIGYLSCWNEDIVRAISLRRRTTMDDRLAYKAFRWQEMINQSGLTYIIQNRLSGYFLLFSTKSVDPNKT
jgi:hypothetical protein